MAEKKENQDFQDLYVRTLADFQNYKKRVEKERSTWMFQAQIDILQPLLTVMDDLDRAVISCHKHEECEEQKGVLAGLELIKKNVEKTFKDLGVKEVDCSGQFNPDLHEALLEVESPDHTSGDIVEVVNKGYEYKSEVIRHAKVSVAK